MSNIHPTAIIEDGAQIAASAKVGPYCLIGPHVVLEDNVVLHGHVAVAGRTHIGEGTVVFPFASLGHPPQDLKFGGEESQLIIGKRNTIREHVTMNPGTQGGGLITRVGDDCLFMVATHVAHDCHVGNHVILANNATLAGHVHVGDGAIIGGLAAVHQFVRIGANAIIGGLSGVEADVIPYGSVIGERASLAGLNLVGMKRRQMERPHIHGMRNAFKMLFDSRDGTVNERAKKVEAEFGSVPPVRDVLDFIQAESKRSLCTPKHGVLADGD